MIRALLISSLLFAAACGRRDPLPSCNDHWAIPARFELKPDAGQRYGTTDGGMPDYLLIADQDAGTLTEQFVRDGHSYRITYRVTECALVSF
jgi:hypothetical protein